MKTNDKTFEILKTEKYHQERQKIKSEDLM